MTFSIEFTDSANRQLNKLDKERRRFLLLTIHSTLCVDPSSHTETTGNAYPLERYFETIQRDGHHEHRFGIELSIDKNKALVLIGRISCATYWMP